MNSNAKTQRLRNFQKLDPRRMSSTLGLLKWLYRFSWVLVVYAFLRMIFILPLSETVRSYYTINYDTGTYTQIEGFDTAIINPTQLSNYVKAVVGDIYNYDALNYYDHYSNVVSQYFQKEALPLFYKSVEPRLNQVAKDGVAVSSALLAAVQINDYGYVGNQFIFNVSVPIRVTYASKLGNYYEDTLVKLTLLRVPVKEHITGLKILALYESQFYLDSIYKIENK